MENTTNLFPSHFWKWHLGKNNKIEIHHSSGEMKFVSPIQISKTREDKLELFKSDLNLNEKDIYLIEYIMDFFINKSAKDFSQDQAMVLAANLVSSYKFSKVIPLDFYIDQLDLSKTDNRKFGEHLVYKNKKGHKVFVIGKSSNALFCVLLEELDDYPGLTLCEISRSNLRKNFI